MVHTEATEIARRVGELLEDGYTLGGCSVALVRLLKILYDEAGAAAQGIDFADWVAGIEQSTSFGGKPGIPVASA